MIYTVSETAKILNIAPSTLRYYDREGLLPFIERTDSGIRMFKDSDIEWLYIIDCLKKTGMPLRDIKHFIMLAQEGDGTIRERLQLFLKQRESVLEQIQELEDTLEILNYKCWYYQTALEHGTTSIPRSLSLEEIPKQHQNAKKRLQKIHEGSHKTVPPSDSE